MGAHTSKYHPLGVSGFHVLSMAGASRGFPAQGCTDTQITEFIYPPELENALTPFVRLPGAAQAVAPHGPIPRFCHSARQFMR